MKGDVVLVMLANYPGLFNASPEDLDSIFPIGTILAIREPTYVREVMSNSPNPYVRVESPSDIFLMDSSGSFPQIPMWGSARPGAPTHLDSGEKWKALGAKEFKNGRWLPAAICYSNCIKYGYDIDVSILNKAEVYLRLGWFHGAFHNAKVAVDSGTLNDDLVKKAVVRMIKAHYGLGRYSAALEAAKTFPKDLNVKELSERAKERLKEQATGEYDWCRLFDELQNNLKGYRPDVADFIGPVEVKIPKGAKGVRGVFVTRDVKAGELLVRQHDLSLKPKFKYVFTRVDVLQTSVLRLQ